MNQHQHDPVFDDTPHVDLTPMSAQGTPHSSSPLPDPSGRKPTLHRIQTNTQLETKNSDSSPGTASHTPGASGEVVERSLFDSAVNIQVVYSSSPKPKYQFPIQALQSLRDAEFSPRETDAKEVEEEAVEQREEAEPRAQEEELKRKEGEAKEEARRKDEELRKGEELRRPSTDEPRQPSRSHRAPSPNALVRSLSPMTSTLHTASNLPTFVDSKLSACRRLISHAFSPHETVPLIEVIFTSKAEIVIIRGLRGDDAQTFIDVVHEVRPHFFFHLRGTF